MGRFRIMAVAGVMFTTAACGTAAGQQLDGATDKLRGPSKEIADRVTGAAAGAADKAPAYASTLRSNAVCLGREVTDRIGTDDVKALLATRGNLSSAPDQLAGHAVDLRQAVASCVDLRATLITVFEGVGLDRTQAECVADQALNDDKILGPLLINMVFGDPGIGAAAVVAIRATRGCVTPADLARLVPG